MLSKLAGINVDPIHWLLLGVVVLLSLTGVAYWKQSQDLKVCKAEYSGFVSKTEVKGLESLNDKLRLEASNETLTKRIGVIQNEKKLALDAAYSDYDKRMREYKTSAGKRGEAGLSEATSGINCGNDEARLSASLDNLEAGIFARLVKSRDEAINRTIACKQYLDELPALYKNNIEDRLNAKMEVTK